jgi:hypothetical protein
MAAITNFTTAQINNAFDFKSAGQQSANEERNGVLGEWCWENNKYNNTERRKEFRPLHTNITVTCAEL